MIVGIDEVGRGPWAGPLVVCAVALNGANISGLTDSKKLTKIKRQSLSREIIDSLASVGLGWVQADEIDEIGLSQSLVEATKRALKQITTPYHEIIIDGKVNFLKDTPLAEHITTLKKADLLVPSVSAASIVAKVARDTFMHEQALLYPDYGFASHVGYGTADHRSAIEAHGVTPLHRLSFAPLAQYRTKSEAVQKPSRVTSKQIGDKAEDVAAEWLLKRSYSVVERNWKTKYCEIDIVARRDDVWYYVEVKHRRSDSFGGGVAAISATKKRQMEFAAKIYIQQKSLHDQAARLVVITSIGDTAEVTDLIEL